MLRNIILSVKVPSYCVQSGRYFLYFPFSPDLRQSTSIKSTFCMYLNLVPIWYCHTLGLDLQTLSFDWICYLLLKQNTTAVLKKKKLRTQKTTIKEVKKSNTNECVDKWIDPSFNKYRTRTRFPETFLTLNHL